jgi:hypothetical protein
LSLSPDKPQVGNLAAWFLTFHGTAPGSQAPMTPTPGDKSFGFDRYNAEITAALAGGLSGGSFSITVEGMTDEDYLAIQLAQGEKRFARLYLGWADTNASLGGYLASVIGISAAAGAQPPPAELLVAVLQVDSVTRKSGSRRYETTITARDWIYVQAARSWTTKEPVTGATREEALKQLLEGTAGMRSDDYKIYPPTPNPNPDATAPPPPSPTPKVELPGKTRVLKILEQQRDAMAAETASYGRDTILLRDGAIHLGIRPIPFVKGDPPKKLTLATGVVEVEAVAPTVPNPDPAPGDKKAVSQFKLTLKGRPDLKPGDVVEFDAPSEDTKKTQAGVLGGISGPLIPDLGQFSNGILLYVDSVQHRLGRTTGFVTTLTGIEVTKGQEWDPPPPTPEAQVQCPGASPELDAAKAIRGKVRGELQGRAGTEIGEVRAVTVTGSAEPPGQTETVWRGLVPGDGHGYVARRGEIKRPSLSPVTATPYLTPFAFGKCGLVLPRYPGTRVAIIHRDGKCDDPIDVGALWPSGKGPDQAAAGDWWLILPSEVTANERTSLPDTTTTPPADYTGKVTHDLIDADGNRVIELGELTVRIGRGALQGPGVRPARASDQDSITIEHADGGSKLVLKADGSIQIKGTNIELDAGSGQITLKASAVNVQ